MIHRNAGALAWSFWKRNQILGLDSVTDLYIADDSQFRFNPDSAHVDIWHPLKGEIDLIKDVSGSNQFNPTGWAGGQSSLSTMSWRADTFASLLAGAVPFSIAFEFEPTVCATNSVLFWLSAGTSSTKAHAFRYTGTAADLQVIRGDGVNPTKALLTTVPVVLSTRNVFIHTFDGRKGRTRINGADVDVAGDLNVNPVAFTNFTISEAFTTGVSNGSTNSARSVAIGVGFTWTDEIPIIEAQMLTSAGLA